jgi:hypothetical protein
MPPLFVQRFEFREPVKGLTALLRNGGVFLKRLIAVVTQFQIKLALVFKVTDLGLKGQIVRDKSDSLAFLTRCLRLANTISNLFQASSLRDKQAL